MADKMTLQEHLLFQAMQTILTGWQLPDERDTLAGLMADALPHVRLDGPAGRLVPVAEELIAAAAEERAFTGAMMRAQPVVLSVQRAALARLVTAVTAESRRVA